jgi:hypothetical protein
VMTKQQRRRAEEKTCKYFGSRAAILSRPRFVQRSAYIVRDKVTTSNTALGVSLSSSSPTSLTLPASHCHNNRLHVFSAEEACVVRHVSPPASASSILLELVQSSYRQIMHAKSKLRGPRA